MPGFIDLTGKQFGKLTVLGISHRDKRSQIHWLCKCECGVEKSVSGGDLTRKNRKGVQMCGRCENVHRTHNQRNTRLYRIYAGIKSRCYNPNEPHYKDYGGRGVGMCKEWLDDFVAFYDWSVNNGYDEKLSIDRIDNDGNYEPSNCRWTTQKVQNNNKRTNKYIEYKGEVKTVQEWCNLLNVSSVLVYKRLGAGWSVERALTTPSRARCKVNEAS